jgi:hypothetical protein
MALTMMDKQAVRAEKKDWPLWLAQEFRQERERPNACVGTELLSESDRVRVWMIRLKPGERIGFHRHVLDYFWSAVTPGRGRQHLQDGSTVEHSYQAGETRHETYRKSSRCTISRTSARASSCSPQSSFSTAPTRRSRCLRPCAARTADRLRGASGSPGHFPRRPTGPRFRFSWPKLLVFLCLSD